MTPGNGAAIPVHPHARGDNREVLQISHDLRGSPPRPWGQSDALIGVDYADRFTPTPVGTILTCLAF